MGDGEAVSRCNVFEVSSVKVVVMGGGACDFGRRGDVERFEAAIGIEEEGVSADVRVLASLAFSCDLEVGEDTV